MIKQRKKCSNKNCRRKGLLIGITGFTKDKGKKDGRSSECKECAKIRNDKNRDVKKEPTMTKEEQKEYANDFSYLKKIRDDIRNEKYGINR